MRRQPSLRSQLNQIRMWVRQGRTDAWIAHKLDVSVDELARFKREHALDGGDEGTRARPADPLSVPPPEPRSYELEADEEDEEEEDEEVAERPPERSRRRRSRRSRSRRPVTAGDGEDDDDEEFVAIEEADEDQDEEEPEPRALDRDKGEGVERDGAARRRRRRGRRGGRRHRPRRNAYEATFDHGAEGYGLWLDPAVADNPVYSEHWAGHRAVTVTVEAEAITIRRAGPAGDRDVDAGSGEQEEDR